MADQLITPTTLASHLQQDLDLSTAIVAIEASTSIVQNAAGRQRLVRVEDDPFTLIGTPDVWLALPQRPVVSATQVAIDDEGLADEGAYRLLGSRLRRTCGWGGSCVLVTGVYSHGYADDDQRIQLAKTFTLALAAPAYDNAKKLQSERLDDYSVAYAAATETFEASPAMARALQRQYGRPLSQVRVGV